MVLRDVAVKMPSVPILWVDLVASANLDFLETPSNNAWVYYKIR